MINNLRYHNELSFSFLTSPLLIPEPEANHFTSPKTNMYRKENTKNTTAFPFSFLWFQVCRILSSYNGIIKFLWTNRPQRRWGSMMKKCRKRYRNTIPRTAARGTNLVFGVLAALVWFFSPAPVSAQESCTIFNYTGGLQSYTVPAGVTSIKILAAGAKGGNESNCGSCFQGGLGALVSGEFAVTPGETLQIIVGQKGSDDFSDAGGGEPPL